MKKLSQSELYTLSRCSYSFDIQSTENVVIPNIDSDHPSTISIATTTTTTTPPSKISAFSHRRGLVAVADNEVGVQKRKRKRKSKVKKGNSEEFEGFGVNGEEINLKFLARVADGAFEAELNRMTEGMVREDEFLGFLKGLEGRWGSSRKRRRYVDTADFVKALPTNWKILLSLRPRARQPSLYCWRFRT
ncbi:hypothetical protein L1887_09434 [Cichorium endivia]|nr:hypothetical protein L1887_09434 [Cichorium endivia]